MFSPEKPQVPSSNIFSRAGRYVRGLSLITGLAIGSIGLFAPENRAEASTDKYVEVGMPFDGAWASSASGQANIHDRYWGDWAEDIFGLNKDVYLNVSAPQGGELSFNFEYNNTGCPAGKGVILGVSLDGAKVGELYYEHLDNAVTSGPITNHMKLGTTKNWGEFSCYQPGSDAGVHTHFEPKSGDGNYACWFYHDIGQTLNAGTPIARLGKTNATGVQQQCNTSSTINTGSGSTVESSNTTPYSTIGEGGMVTNGSWVYRKVGGRLWPVKPRDQWNSNDATYWGGNPATVANAEVQANEVGYDQDGPQWAAHPPGDGTTVYVDGGNGQQWYFYKGRAYPITSTEVDELGVRNAAQRIPGTGDRLSEFTYGVLPLDNMTLYRFANTARVNRMAEHPDGTREAYYANNDTVLACYRLTENRGVIILPRSAQPYVEDYLGIPEISHPAACQFADNMVLSGPGGLEQWHISGNNDSIPYVRHYYPSPLVVAMNTANQPNYQTLPSVSALNDVVQGNNMYILNGAYIRNAGNGEVYRWENGYLRKVPSPATLQCLGNPFVQDIAEQMIVGTPQSTQINCGYEGRIIYGSNGTQYYIYNGLKYGIINPAISNCIVVRRQTGSPIGVADATLNEYANGPIAHCTYEQEPGLNFVREDGDSTVWLVHADGTKQHVGSLCVGGYKKYQVFVVPRTETAGHVQTSDWFANASTCAALAG